MAVKELDTDKDPDDPSQEASGAAGVDNKDSNENSMENGMPASTHIIRSALLPPLS